jgi:hypothetical protein
MEEGAEGWFSLLLMEWTDDRTKWPEDLSWENLNNFFHVNYQSMVMDLVNEPIEKDSDEDYDDDTIDPELN